MLADGSDIVTSPIKIANIINKYYIEKVQQIRNGFIGNIGDPLMILKKNYAKMEVSPIPIG